MINRIKLVVLSVLVGMAGITSQAAIYNGNLIIGFSDGVGNDLAYDLGPAASVTNGQTWNLNSLLISYNLSAVNWGVVGATVSPGGTSRKIYTTRGVAPSTVGGLSGGNGIFTAVSAIYQPFVTAGAGQSVSTDPTGQNSWNQQTINPTLSTQYRNQYGNPNAVGVTSISFWQATANQSAPVLIGGFSLAGNGVVTFTTVSSAPPPPKLTLTRSGNTSSISFLSTNNATYKLYFTNSSGLTNFLTNWSSVGTTVAGDGTTKTFTDSTTDSNRFYRVNAY